MLSVEFDPPQISTGMKGKMKVEYEVMGVPAGQTVNVRETRAIFFRGQEASVFTDEVTRRSGRFSSQAPLYIPTGAALGEYLYKCSIEIDGEGGDMSAKFEVVQ